MFKNIIKNLTPDRSFHEIYNLLTRDKNYPDFLICEKVEFETQENPSGVEFNYRKVMECEDDPNTEVVGFFHTHPMDCPNMSTTDIETMKAWVTCLGRPLLCVIGSSRKYYMPHGQHYIQEQTFGWWCRKNIAIQVNVAEFDPDCYVFCNNNGRFSHIIVKNSYETAPLQVQFGF